MTHNERIFLDLIIECEGTAKRLDLTKTPYNCAFGHRYIADLSRHPNIRYAYSNTYTTAAGAYQFLFATWDRIRKKLNLPDFGQNSQDLAALELIRERGAISDINSQNWTAALKKVSSEWASLPYATYGQPTKSLEFCHDFLKKKALNTIAQILDILHSLPLSEQSIILDVLENRYKKN